MIKKTTKILGIRVAIVTLLGVLLTSPVLAREATYNPRTRSLEVSDSSLVIKDPTYNQRTRALEAQVKKMKTMMHSMQAELSRVRAMAKSGTSATATAKMQELDEWVKSVKSTPSVAPKEHMVFFRGGYAGNDHSREGSILTDVNALPGNKPNGDEEAWYFGAGFEFNLTNDLYGLMDNTSLYGEVTVGYKEFDNQTLNLAPLGALANSLAQGCPDSTLGRCSANVTVTQITLTASPKIKFMHGSKFRPWIIPAGFAVHVISPPSDGVTVTAPGILFGAGAEYNIWKGVNIGFDGRYHLVSNTLADVNLDGFEVGGYVGFGF